MSNESNSEDENSDSVSMSDKTRYSMSETTRRGALTVFGTGLLSISTGTTSGAEPEMIEVPELLSGDSVDSYMRVPKKWHEHRQNAISAKEALLDRVSDIPSVFDVALISGDSEHGGATGFQIRVRMSDMSKKDKIPSEHQNIPIDIQPAPQSHGPGGCYNSGSQSSAVGGEAVGWDNGYGTATTGVIHENKSETHLLHCAHVFYSDCEDVKNNGLKGREAFRGLPDDNTPIGNVTKSWDRKGDYVIIEPNDTSSFSRYIDENDQYPDMVGAVSQNKIDYMASNDDTEPIIKMGVTHGKNYGDIVASNVSFTSFGTCYNFRTEGVESTTRFANGDSGGPTYLRRNGDAYISHVSSYRYYDNGSITTCFDNSVRYGRAVGTAAYYIRNNEPIKFDKDQ